MRPLNTMTEIAIRPRSQIELPLLHPGKSIPKKALIYSDRNDGRDDMFGFTASLGNSGLLPREALIVHSYA